MVDTGHSRRPVDNISYIETSSSRTTAAPRLTETRRPRRRTTSAGWSGAGPDTTGGGPAVAGRRDTVGYVLDVKRALAAQPALYRQFVDVLRRYHDNQHPPLPWQRQTQRRHDNQRHHDNQRPPLPWQRHTQRYHDNQRHHDNQRPPLPWQRHTQRCHDNQRGAGQDLNVVRRIVSLLRATPQLVLGFNDFLPHGYRILMFDRSAYVIEYPDTVSGTTARSTIAV